MNLQYIISVLLVCAPLAAPVSAAPLKVAIHSESGFYVHEHGSATLVAVPGGTQVTLHLHGVPKGAVQPMHIHSGRCGKLDPHPAWALNPVTHSGYSQSTIPVSLKRLQSQPYAINIHKSARDVTVYVACGNIPVRRH
ncbi:MAG TPA: hypothetical protein VFN52_06590 [Acidiferrobacteraceae bacterium]|nr:hypothetical protein [Acidiferrobacteraceae bacterium]